jgi:hypothetical protein
MSIIGETRLLPEELAVTWEKLRRTGLWPVPDRGS